MSTAGARSSRSCATAETSSRWAPPAGSGIAGLRQVVVRLGFGERSVPLDLAAAVLVKKGSTRTRHPPSAHQGSEGPENE